MEDQVRFCSSCGLKSIKVGADCTDEIKKKIVNGEYQMIYVSPESLLARKRWRKMLLSDVYQQNLVAIVIDEAHCVRNWYVMHK